MHKPRRLGLWHPMKSTLHIYYYYRLYRFWSIGLIIVVVALPWFVISRCHSKPTGSSILILMLAGESSCTLPCWLGIVPGLSTEADFAKVAEIYPERFEDLKRNAFGFRFVQFIWRDRILDGVMSSELENDIVTHITMQFEADIGLQTALDQLGMPDTYASQLSTGEVTIIALYLFYENRGIVVETTMTPGEVQPVDCSYALPNSLVIRRLHFLPATPARTVLDTLPQLFPGQLNPSPWTGTSNLQLSACHP